MAELARLQPALKAKLEDLFMGLPTDLQKEILEHEEAVNGHQGTD